MDDLTMWSLIVGTLAPLVIALVQQPKWSTRTRTVVGFVGALILGTGTAFFQGDFTGRNITSSVLIVLVASLSTYKHLWTPAGVAPAVEGATSPTDRPALTEA